MKKCKLTKFQSEMLNQKVRIEKEKYDKISD